MRMTLATQQVLRFMLKDASTDHYGLELMRSTGLKSGTLYPILARLEKNEWIEGRWEDVDPSGAGRPRRRLYRFTPNGVLQARTSGVDTAAVLGLQLAGGPA